ncbi:hypothetical protein Q9L58_006376 [Maublancomyces gigas]|uniref:Uncharacterized protein n=1 Tax=Discina gigas TaxID=1032678 RepID=A0ABR3GFT7_9PEZI
MTWSTASTQAASTTATIHRENQTITVLTLNDVDISRVFAYVMSEKGARIFITFPLGDHITQSNSSCCNYYHTHAGYDLPKQKVPTQESEICCPRLVIETVADGGKFTAQVLESPKNDDLNNFPGMTLDNKRLPKGSKTIKLSWFAITFGSKAGKLRFITEYHRLERIRKAKTVIGKDLLASLRGEEMKGESVKMDGERELNDAHR